MNALEAAIVAKLAAAAPPIPAYLHPAPSDVAMPMVTFNKQDGRPRKTFGPGSGTVKWRDFLYFVRVIAPGGSVKAARELEARVATALDGAELNVAGYDTMLVERESDVEYPEVVGGERYNHIGGLYRVLLTPEP